MAVDRVAEAAFQRPPGLGRGLRLRQFALVELPSRAAGADLADRDQVQGADEVTRAGVNSRGLGGPTTASSWASEKMRPAGSAIEVRQISGTRIVQNWQSKLLSVGAFAVFPRQRSSLHESPVVLT